MRTPVTARPHAGEPPPPEVGADALRAALRLLLDGATADRLMALTGDRPSPADVRRLVGRIAPRYTVARWWHRARRSRTPATPVLPLGPGCGLTARQAVLLALHVGTGWGGAALASLLDADAEQIGADLATARVRLAGPGAHPCAEGAALAGRYRDPDLPLDDRAELLAHAARCRSCQEALAKFDAVDARLVAVVEAARASLPPAPPHHSRLRRAAAAPPPVAAALVALALLAIFGLTVGRGLLPGSRSAPVPLLAAGAAAPALPDGWLLYERADGGLAALDTGTGAAAALAPARGASTFTPGQAYVLSPDDAYLASVSPNFNFNGLAPAVTLTVSRLGGTVVYQHTWVQNPPTLVSLDGWLDATTILAGVAGSGSPQLIAIDVVTQQTRVLFSGDFTDAVPSPDGRWVAITGGDAPIWLGLTLEIRPVEPGGLGAPTATVAHRFARVGQPVWSRDGRLYFGMIADPSVGTSNPNAPLPAFEEPQEITLAALAPDGRLTRLTAPATLRYDLPLAVSPDGTRVLFERQGGANTSAETIALRAVRSDGSGGQAILANVTSVDGVGWLPDGESALALVGQPYPLPSDANQTALGPVTLPVLYQIGAGDAAHPVRALPDAGGRGAFQWLPRAALSPPGLSPAPGPATGRLTAPAPVTGLGTAGVGPGSAASDDGRYVVLQDQVSHTPDVWAPPPEETRQVYYDVTQLSWVPGEHLAVGALAARPGQPPQPSRLTLLSMPPGSGPLASSDSRSFDPASVGNDLSRVYALPRVSPDGLSVAFYVVDDRSGIATLWLATAGARPRPVAGWSIRAAPSVGTVPLTLAWATNDTFVFTEPADWQGSLPQAVALERLSIAPDGTTTITRLRTLPASGGDAALVAPELSFSADGRYLALRLRHVDAPFAGSALTDSIDILPTVDLRQSVELARGGAGSGLTWSPGGDWLAFALDDGVTVASADGRRLSGIAAGLGRSGSPCWVGPDHLWFDYAPPGSAQPQTMQVTVR